MGEVSPISPENRCVAQRRQSRKENQDTGSEALWDETVANHETRDRDLDEEGRVREWVDFIVTRKDRHVVAENRSTQDRARNPPLHPAPRHYGTRE